MLNLESAEMGRALYSGRAARLLTAAPFYLRCYQTERASANSADRKWLEQAEANQQRLVPSLSHPGGRRFESGWLHRGSRWRQRLFVCSRSKHRVEAALGQNWVRKT